MIFGSLKKSWMELATVVYRFKRTPEVVNLRAKYLTLHQHGALLSHLVAILGHVGTTLENLGAILGHLAAIKAAN